MFYLHSFDEPDDLDRPDREVLTAGEELARLQAQKKASWLSRWKKDKSTAATPEISRRPSAASADAAEVQDAQAAVEAVKAYRPYDADDIEIPPPRTSTEAISQPAVTATEKPPEVEATVKVTPPVDTTTDEVKEEVKGPAIKSKDAGVGFDLDKIRETIASDDGSGQLPVTAPMPSPKLPNGQRQSADELRPPTPSNAPKGKSLFGRLRSKPDLTRTGSAPIPTPTSSAGAYLPNGQSAEQLQYEAQQRMLEEQEKREEEAFKRGLPLNQLYPATDNPFASSTASLPSLDSGTSFADPYAFTNGSQAAPGLSFGGVDGSISFAEDERDTWQSSGSSTTNNGSAWKDPWQTSGNNAWSSSSRW